MKGVELRMRRPDSTVQATRVVEPSPLKRTMLLAVASISAILLFPIFPRHFGCPVRAASTLSTADSASSRSFLVKPPFRPGSQIAPTGFRCDCSRHGDINGDGHLNPVDLVQLTNFVFKHRGSTPRTDPACPAVNRGDFNCDDLVNAVDVQLMIDFIYSAGPGPCNPCKY